MTMMALGELFDVTCSECGAVWEAHNGTTSSCPECGTSYTIEIGPETTRSSPPPSTPRTE